MIIDGKNYSFTQAMCVLCWEEKHGPRQPVTVRHEHRTDETCCFCGLATRSGIFTRVDPRTVGYPSPERDE